MKRPNSTGATNYGSLSSTTKKIKQIMDELIETKTTLKEIEIKKTLRVDQKIYRKLSDIEIILNKMECHSNESLKLMRFQVELIYHQLKATTNYNEKAKDDWWKRYCRITD